MAGPAMAIGLFLLACYFGLILFLLYYTIRNRHNKKRAIPAGILFWALTTFTIYIYWSMNRSEDEAAQKFLGDYKLNSLDRRKCENCKVRLKEGYTYDIIVNYQVVGNGKWHIGTAIDIPGAFLVLDNGPAGVIWESDRLIEYIDRTQY